MNGPFFQNPNNYPMLLSHPAHKGTVQVPAKKIAEGIYYKKFPFLVEVQNPKPEDVVFSQTNYENNQLPLQKAEPLPNTTTAVNLDNTDLDNTDLDNTDLDNTGDEEETVLEDTTNTESVLEPSPITKNTTEVKGNAKTVLSKKDKKKGKK